MTPDIRIRTRLLGLALLGALGTAPATQAGPALVPYGVLVPPPESGTPWESLSPEEQRLLRQHAPNWRRYPSDYRQRLRDGVNRYEQMSPEERRAVRSRAQQFENLNPAEKRRLCDRYHREHGRLPPVCRPPRER